ncbi:MAG: rod shape-determining protein RodA [Deltaproteobacteria bacterium]|jgi:rod shape determining protein RodA|nr:rod shape-determining protein RodA [Deltaproteobacteria bacterium]MBT4526563.1 rod shape-determining protein RodA [Deltaproteobacteria bacterium]
MFDRRLLEQFDWILLLLVISISIIGFFTIYSASITYNSGTSYYQRQILWFFISLIIMFLVTMIDYHLLTKLSFWGHIVLILLLVIVLIYGTGGPGSRVQRWIKLGPIFFQPSEFVKFTMVLYLSYYFSDSRRINNLGFKGIIWPLTITLIPFVLIIKQPDLGTAGILIFVFVSIIFLVGLKYKVILITTISGLISLPFIWFFLLRDYQRSRIITLINPESDPLGKGYQIIQSKIAVGSGQLWGKGFLEGTQAKLNFLPARHTDFIFSIFTEEWGFIGGCALIGLYILLIVRCLKYVGKSKDRSGTILTVGITSVLVTHIIINIGMVLGLLPIVGMPLPFMSYGGSAMISNMIGIGLILNVRMRRFLY